MLPRDQGPASTGAEPGRASSVAEQKDVAQPAEAEYLSSRCVLFTYFKGDIGDEVDEHFSRALSQSSTFGSEAKSIRVTQPSASNNLWKGKKGNKSIFIFFIQKVFTWLCIKMQYIFSDGSLPEAQGSSAWSGVFSSQTNSCLPAVSVSVHPEFSSSPVSFSHPDGALWAGHVLSQASIPSAATLPDTWTYSLSPQSPSGYPHEVYHPHPHSHPHIHPRHHPMLHSYPPHSPALDPRFNALLLPHGVRSQSQVTGSTGSSPHSEGGKTEMDLSSNSPVTATSAPWSSSALHGSLEVYDSGR